MHEEPRAAAPPSRSSGPVLGEGTFFEGLVLLHGEAVVEGEVHGELVGADRLRIGPAARVVARVEAGELWVAGCVEGQIQARTRVDLAASAQVRGDLRAPRVRVAEGARFEGRCITGPRAEAGPESPESP